MEDTDRRAELGAFLRACRERTSPEGFALNTGARRRTPGLRREEIATLAGISTAYYTKIEQGRVDVSAHVLGTLANLFSMSHTEREYAFALASDHTVAAGNQPVETMHQQLEILLASMDPYPAQILGHRWQFLGWNQSTAAVLGDLGALPETMRNLVVMMFLMPQMRATIGDWPSNAQRMLAQFRADYGRYHFDAQFADLIAYLRANSPEFDHWWLTLPDIGAPGNATKVIHHPDTGPLYLLETVFDVHDHPGLRLIMFLPQDDDNKRKLEQLLASYRAGLGTS